MAEGLFVIIFSGLITVPSAAFILLVKATLLPVPISK